MTLHGYDLEIRNLEVDIEAKERQMQRKQAQIDLLKKRRISLINQKASAEGK